MDKKRKVIKKQAISLVAALVFTLSLAPAGYALSDELIPLGRTTGMKFFSKGAMVVGFSEVDGVCPAQKAGLQIGDIIISVNGQDISCNETLAKAVLACDTQAVTVKALRGEEEKTFSVNAVVDNTGNKRIGAWVRDSMAGIGTITFVDPATGEFAALGHGVADMDTGELMPMDNGSLMHSSVVGVNKGKQGEPGELKGEYDLKGSQGTLDSNKNSGVYGVLQDQSLYQGKDCYPVAKKSEITKGKAHILANVSGDTVEQFEIEIMTIYDKDDEQLRDMMLKVTDPRLISITGGIVQGMSGSPIIQNGKLVGAVTHVLVNDPLRGYGIAIERMVTDCS